MLIKIDHIAKIEGHAGFVAEIANGQVEKVRLDILEGARLLEGILRSRSVSEVSQISARICGVCPVVHNLTSLKALEEAMDIKISPQTLLLRKLLMLGQIMNSHALHLFFFSLSDFFGLKDDLGLIKKFPKKAEAGMAIREFGNKIIEVIGGRSIHPLTPQVGGFTKLPDLKKLAELKKQSDEVLKNALDLANLFSKLKYPDFKHISPFVSLSAEDEYPFYDGLIKTSLNRKFKTNEFLSVVKEHQIALSAVKRTEFEGQTFMVGALSRLGNNALLLNPEAKKLLHSSKIELPSANPFFNIFAQAIEMVHCAQEAKKLLTLALEKGLTEEENEWTPKAGEGFGAIEAPRGTLYYYYRTSNDGLIEDCNIITPTSQNLARLESDLKEYLPKLVGQNAPKKEMEEKIKMLVRAYDPCLTCATH